MSKLILPTRPGAIIGYTKRGLPIRVIAGGDGTTPNPYLTRKREQAAKLKASIDGMQTRAAEADPPRDLTEDELKLITEQSAQYRSIVDEIESLTDVELRSQKVTKLAARVAGGGDAGGDDAGKPRDTSGAQAKDRDPGHYRSVEDGGQRSFFADLYRAKGGDREAERFLTEHTRALRDQKDRAALTGDNAGVIPPIWMGELWDEGLRQGRAAANAVRRIPITSSAPLSLPRQDNLLTLQEDISESSETEFGSPDYESSVVTVTPRPTSGKQDFSRELLDASNPVVDGLILEDLVGANNDRVEARVVAAILGAGPAALVAAAGVEATDNLHIHKVGLRAQVAVRRNRKRARANAYVMSISRWGAVLETTDTTGRPLVPEQTIGQAVNVAGVGSVMSDGIWRGLPIIATEAAEPDAITDPLEDTLAALRLQDILLFESGIQRFTFEEPKGPEKIIVAVWTYSATHVRYGGAGVQTVDVEVSPSV